MVICSNNEVRCGYHENIYILSTWLTSVLRTRLVVFHCEVQVPLACEIHPCQALPSNCNPRVAATNKLMLGHSQPTLLATSISSRIQESPKALCQPLQGRQWQNIFLAGQSVCSPAITCLHLCTWCIQRCCLCLSSLQYTLQCTMHPVPKEGMHDKRGLLLMRHPQLAGWPKTQASCFWSFISQ